jgi:hypothetical protein
MFDTLYEFYAKYWLVRWVYQIGFFVTWAVWAAKSLDVDEVTWLVFGWLPAVFWPLEFVARLVLPLLQPYVAQLEKLVGLT